MKAMLKNKIKTGLLATLLIMPGPILLAQERVTLDQAVATAISQHPSLKSSELAVQIAEVQLSSEKSSRIPEIHSDLSVQRNLIIPSTPVPLGVISGEGNPNDLTFMKFGTDWQSNIGLFLNYDIFNPRIKQQIIAGEENRKLAEIDYKAKKSATIIAVTKAYAELVLATAQFQYVVEDTMYNHKALSVAMNQFSLGQLSEKRYNESRLRMNQSLSRYSQTKKVYEQARIELAYHMGIPLDTASLPKTADSLEKLLEVLEEETMSAPMAQLTNGYLRLSTQVQYDSLQLANTKLMMLPTLSLKGGYGSNYYLNEFQPFNTANWYGNSFVALSVRIPITKDIATHYKLSKARLELDQSAEDMEDFYKRREADIQKTLVDLEHSRDELDKRALETKLEEENLIHANEQFEAGRLLPGDLQQELLQRENAKIAYLQASYDYILSLLNLKDLTESR